jgi:PadR family transcriptional regulator, regulatory protein PadR
MGSKRIEFLRGTLDMLILTTLSQDELHGYAIADRIKLVSKEVLEIDEGSLYPALQRMLSRGWIKARWGTSENNRRARYYKLTPKGRRQLDDEVSSFERLASAIFRVVRTG